VLAPGATDRMSDETTRQPDFSDRLHALRGEALRGLPSGARTVLHGGGAGPWYFEWFDAAYPGAVDRHISVEYFAPEPSGLPPNVQWLPRTLGDITPVADAEVDLVFAGQVIEHLWPDDVAGFLAEAHRVLAAGGSLVMDSPNRAITEQIGWLHPQHTAELSVPEVVELVRLAGFDVESVRGLVLGYDRERHVFLGLDDQSMAWEDRARLAVDRPEESMIWWLTAHRADREPQRGLVRQRAHDIGEAFRTRRLRRLQTPLPIAWGQDRPPTVSTPPGYQGSILHGPYIPLDGGHWRATFRLRLEDVGVAPDRPIAHVDAYSSPDAVVLGGREIVAGELDGDGRWTLTTLDFSLASMLMGLELRVFAHHDARFGARLAVELERSDDAATGALGDVRATANIPEPRTVELLGMLGRRAVAKAAGRLPGAGAA
jgi:SAM-dependent methyltransferase